MLTAGKENRSDVKSSGAEPMLHMASLVKINSNLSEQSSSLVKIPAVFPPSKVKLAEMSPRKIESTPNPPSLVTLSIKDRRMEKILEKQNSSLSSDLIDN